MHGDWLAFSSSHCPLKVWLKSALSEEITAAFSSRDVSDELLKFGKPSTTKIPEGAYSAVEVADMTFLYSLLKRAFQLSRALPNEPLNEFLKQTRSLPQTTEVERVVVQRVGQDIFRERLIEFWDGKCAVTGLAIPALLKASHIKPWKDCATDAERLDVYNGLLLAPHLDAVFDRGFITFGDDGLLMTSKSLGADGLKILGIAASSKCENFTASHFKFLSWHRTKVFRGN